jgi:hypothetical protein
MAGRPVGWRDQSVIGQPLVTMTHVLAAVLSVFVVIFVAGSCVMVVVVVVGSAWSVQGS